MKRLGGLKAVVVSWFNCLEKGRVLAIEMYNLEELHPL
jgi:hypothetical protein